MQNVGRANSKTQFHRNEITQLLEKLTHTKHLKSSTLSSILVRHEIRTQIIMRPLTDRLAVNTQLNLVISLFLPGHGYWKINISPLGDKNVMARSNIGGQTGGSSDTAIPLVSSGGRFTSSIKSKISSYTKVERRVRALVHQVTCTLRACDILGKQTDPHTTTTNL